MKVKNILAIFVSDWIIILIKLGIVLFMIGSFMSSFFIPFSTMMSIFLNTSIPFLVLTILIFAFTTDQKDSDLMIKMWTLYFPVISLMFIFIYTMENNAQQMKIDAIKTKISMESKTHSVDLNETFHTYNQEIATYLDFYKKKRVS